MAAETLFKLIQNGSFPFYGKRISYLNATFNAGLGVLSDADLVLQQYFKPYVDSLSSTGLSVQTDIPDDDGSYDFVCIVLPKNMVEARCLMARGATLLRRGGVLVCAADNKAGGARLKKMMEGLGFQDVESESRNKARVVWAKVDSLCDEECKKACDDGCEQQILDGRFLSQAGIFGWDKVDKGSEVLTRYLPKDLKGKGADFGCGYGYLSDYILSSHKKVKHLFCVDADYRAVEVCRKNLDRFECNKDFIWSDLTKPQDALRNLDFIVMNPPFHEGKKMNMSIGQDFIETAYKSLRRGGRLLMVANNHLAYEKILESRFFECKKLYEGQGFKVFCALK